jgi:hypothetical protein
MARQGMMHRVDERYACIEYWTIQSAEDVKHVLLYMLPPTIPFTFNS